MQYGIAGYDGAGITVKKNILYVLVGYQTFWQIAVSWDILSNVSGMQTKLRYTIRICRPTREVY
jgi:hypothetical protein